MLRNRNLRTLSAVLLLVGIALIAVPGVWAASKYESLYRFKGPKDGSFPQAGVVFDKAGNLYGTTLEGGAHGYGTVFKLAPRSGGGWAVSVLHSFNNNGRDGSASYAGLVFDAQGNLYGTSYYGGAGPCTSGQFPGCGVIFELSPNSKGGWDYKVIHTFRAGADGAFPAAAMIVDSEGSLYGTTSSGGTGSGCDVGGYIGCGTVFKLTPSNGGWAETVLHSFGGGADGEYLYGGVIQDAAGNVYGTTENGGSVSGCGNSGCGTVFELTLSGGVWTKTLLYTFSGGSDGNAPVGSLVLDGAGNLYGVTVIGGLGQGTVYELSPSSGGWSETVLHTFCSLRKCPDGALPFAGMIFDQAGNLYGTARFGGAGTGAGVVYELTPNSNGEWQEKVLHNFHDRPGVDPVSNLVFDAAGNLYGTTEGDSTVTFGSVFEITP